uniref:Uncharacterized protein n=1 Tax=Odontella aurita TaxID=265563 RepID=A0A7S4I4C4_9STRA|mmetsp:Transcript_19775/g.57379  ORF Transcript_19775/g.57379 Transcript_19775/m.57379 type:complete len:237 (+) Transcript_19775:163-873(+)
MRLFRLAVVAAVPPTLAFSLPATNHQSAFSTAAADSRLRTGALSATKSVIELHGEITAVKAERERLTAEAAVREADILAKRKALEELEARGATGALLEVKSSTAVSVPETALSIDEECIMPDDVKELSETEKLLKQVKESGTAGVISYALWELAFWTISVPVCIFGYRQLTGHWPDLADKEDMEKLGAEAFAFVNFARFAVPLRIGLALSTAPWIQENLVDRFVKRDETPVCVSED